MEDTESIIANGDIWLFAGSKQILEDESGNKIVLGGGKFMKKLYVFTSDGRQNPIDQSLKPCYFFKQSLDEKDKKIEV